MSWSSAAVVSAPPPPPRTANCPAGARRKTLSAAAVEKYFRLHPELELRHYLCPGCDSLLSVEVAETNSAELQDIELA